jgi:hypothetical protein
MNYKQYYLNQAGFGHLPVYRGVQFQRGYGLGGVFRKFFTWVIPILRQHAIPIAKTFGEEVIKSASNLANDALEGKNIKDSAKIRIDESMKNLSRKAGVQAGEGYKRRTKKRKVKHKKFTTKKKQKTLHDIFSKIK